MRVPKRKLTLIALLVLAILACMSLAFSQRGAMAELGSVTSPRIVVQKSQRKLLLYSGKKLVRTYRTGLGGDPVKDKVKEGDLRTPEGKFRIVQKNAKSQFYLSLLINYPRIEDAKRGLRDGLITRKHYQAIVSANRAGRIPPQETPLGGKILIHGGGCSADWTLGCIALNNSEMRELFHAVPVGTPVHIQH